MEFLVLLGFTPIRPVQVKDYMPHYSSLRLAVITVLLRFYVAS